MYQLRVKSLALDNQLIKALPPNRLRALKIFWFPPSRGKGYGMSGGEGCLCKVQNKNGFNTINVVLQSNTYSYVSK